MKAFPLIKNIVDPVMIKMKLKGGIKEVRHRELSLSNKVSLEALVALLIRKGYISATELATEIELIRRERLKPEGDLLQDSGVSSGGGDGEVTGEGKGGFPAGD